MKKFIIILFSVLLLASSLTNAQTIKRSKQKTEQNKTEKKRQSGYNSSKTNKTSKANKKSNPNRFTGMTKAQKDRIIQKAVDDMVWVEGGIFTMGGTEEKPRRYVEINEKPAHQVTLSGYYIGKYEVTQELWQAVMGNNPSDVKNSPKNPVENITWGDCQKFIVKLNELTGKCFRLPTEAEWEYAARGGNQSRGYKYSGSNDLDAVAWHDYNDSWTLPVGTKLPNELGLYDMTGNVWEMCQDWYGDYTNEAQTDPTGPSTGTLRVIRGGCNLMLPVHLRVTYRGDITPTFKNCWRGLRLAASSL